MLYDQLTVILMVCAAAAGARCHRPGDCSGARPGSKGRLCEVQPHLPLTTVNSDQQRREFECDYGVFWAHWLHHTCYQLSAQLLHLCTHVDKHMRLALCL